MSDAEQGIEQFLRALHIDIEAMGLQETPKRVATLYTELFSGLQEEPNKLLENTYPTDYEGLVAVRDIPFYSVCEHHLVPFYGMVHIVYEPVDGKVVGLGRLQKLVKIFARRPQLQERMTSDIAQALMEGLGAKGAMVQIVGTHLCMLMKGEVSHSTEALTLASKGSLKDNPVLQQEALLLLGGTHV